MTAGLLATNAATGKMGLQSGLFSGGIKKLLPNLLNFGKIIARFLGPIGLAAGLVIGGFGVVTVLGIWKGIGSNSAVGAIALLVAITCYGLSFPIIKKYLSPLNLKAEALAASQVSAAAVTLLPFYLIDGIAKNEYRTGPILAMIALGVFGSGLAYIWNFQIVERAGSSIASSVTYLTPLVAVLVGWIFLGEHISWHEPVGGLIILLGAATSQGRFNKKSTA